MSIVLWVFNCNGLVLFLFVNLFIGLVNFMVLILDVGFMVMMGILVGYVVLFIGVVLVLDVCNIFIKI